MCTSGPERSPARVMWGKRSEMPLRIIGARAARPSGECPSWSTKPDHSETLCPPEQCPGGAFFHRTQRVMRFAVNGFLATTHAHVSAWWVANHKIYSRSRYSTHLRSIALSTLPGVSNGPGLIAPRLQVLVAVSLVCRLVVCAVSRRQSSLTVRKVSQCLVLEKQPPACCTTGKSGRRSCEAAPRSV